MKQCITVKSKITFGGVLPKKQRIGPTVRTLQEDDDNFILYLLKERKRNYNDVPQSLIDEYYLEEQ